MKRVLQVVSAALAVVAVLLVWRIVRVWQVQPPQFETPQQIADADGLPPPPSPPVATDAAVEQIVKGNLFETERGAVEEGQGGPDQAPLPPPTNVVLNGVFFQTTGRPMAIMTDTSAGARQLTLQQGDNVGEYQVGSITRQGVTLLGRAGQEFALELAIGKAAEGAGAVPPRSAGTAAAPAAAAQSAAQRAAAARRQAQQLQQQQAQQTQAQQKDGRPVQNRAAAPVAETDPGQARLEALKRLREAASRQ